ncbi:MAG: hypothetical protein JRI25_26270 [Deltaproteobacteria bacterium]|nr:hypothetical protein [Deltaproteobacteria bacterium]
MHWHTPTSIGVLDVDMDGHLDIVCGTVTGVFTGDILYFHNDDPATFDIAYNRKVDTSGPVQCMTVGDFGGDPREDIAIGWREHTGGYAGGVSIYYTDLGTIPLTGVDPSGGYAVNWCAALTVDHFNYGIYPGYYGPMLMDLAAGVKSSPTDAAILLFIR